MHWPDVRPLLSLSSSSAISYQRKLCSKWAHCAPDSVWVPNFNFLGQRLLITRARMFTLAFDILLTKMAVRRSGSVLVAINVVALRWTRLVLGWVVVREFESRSHRSDTSSTTQANSAGHRSVYQQKVGKAKQSKAKEVFGQERRLLPRGK